MKLRRYLLTAFITSFLLSLVAFAHPGSTDSDGGHTNHNSGVYHYHHGYAEHQHTDLDGDGQPDCPYEFDDQTNRNTDYSENSDISSSKIFPAFSSKSSSSSKYYDWGALKPIIIAGIFFLLSLLLYFFSNKASTSHEFALSTFFSWFGCLFALIGLPFSILFAGLYSAFFENNKSARTNAANSHSKYEPGPFDYLMDNGCLPSLFVMAIFFVFLFFLLYA